MKLHIVKRNPDLSDLGFFDNKKIIGYLKKYGSEFYYHSNNLIRHNGGIDGSKCILSIYLKIILYTLKWYRETLEIRYRPGGRGYIEARDRFLNY